MSSCRDTSVARPDQYTRSRLSMPTLSSAVMYVETAPTGTSRPARRRTRTNATAARSKSENSGTAFHGGEHDLVEAVLAYALLILAVLQHGAERRLDRALVERRHAQSRQRFGPVDRLRDARRLVQLEPAHGFDGRRNLASQRVGDALRPNSHDLELAFEIGVVDPVVDAAPLERVVQVARPVRGHDDDRRHLGGEGTELRDGHRVVREDLEQKRFELVVGAVDFVHEQDGRRARPVRDRAEQRTPDQERLRIQLVLGDAFVRDLGGAQVQQLARVVPFVDGLRDVDALVALQADELAAGPAGENLADLGLADTGLAFEQQRTLQLEREEDRGGQTLVGYVVVRGEGVTDVVRVHTSVCFFQRTPCEHAD